MNRFVLLVLGLVLLSFVSVLGVDDEAGYAGAFYYVPIGARPVAMGGAYLAVSDDAVGGLYNPAGMANIDKTLFAASYRAMELDRYLGYASFIVPAKNNAAIGIQWLYAGDKNLQARDSEGRLTGKEISKNDHDFSIVFAKRFEDFVSTGVKMSYLHSSFADMTAYSICIDLGAMFYLSEFIDREVRDMLFVQDIQAGLTLKYLGARYKWNNEDYYKDKEGSVQEDDIPWEIGVGVSARFFDRKLLVATDIRKNVEQNPFFHAGAEYILYRQFVLRSGFSDGRFTAGTGYSFDIGSAVIGVDYAFSTDKADEGSEHIFSFEWRF